MTCLLCWSPTNNPNSQQHIKTKKHQEALKQQNGGFIFKSVITGSDKSGKSLFFDISANLKQPSHHRGYFNLTIIKKVINQKKVSFSLFDLIGNMYKPPPKIKMFFSNNLFSIVIFDNEQLDTFEQSFYRLMMSLTFGQENAQYVLIGNNISKQDEYRETKWNFGFQYSLALTYLHEFYVDFIEINTIDKETTRQKSDILFHSVVVLLLILDKIKTDKSIQIENIIKKIDNPYLYGWYINQLQDIMTLEKILSDGKKDVKLRILALKRINKLGKLNNLNIQDNELLGKIVQLVQQNDNVLYVTFTNEKHPLIRIVALDLIKDHEILKDVSLNNVNLMFRLHALSKLTNDIDFYEIINKIKFDDDINRIVLYHIFREKEEILVKLILSEEDLDISKFALKYINSIKNLQILRLTGREELQIDIQNKLNNLIKNLD
ncbi:MAG: hypothetical protein OEY49_13290 [Candidatus Heimdallarchaeota archaeon]|nr:hypothetical protein [Candidatus Heimdallarchaeota archaeon]